MNEPFVRFYPFGDSKPEPMCYATSLSSGIDLKAYLPDGQIRMFPGDTFLIKTGYCCKLHPDFEGQIRSRSGLALKHNIIVLNAPGTIDADYSHEIGVILHRAMTQHPCDPFTINHGDRIAQFVVSPVVRESLYMPFEMVARNGGFGHTGV